MPTKHFPNDQQRFLGPTLWKDNDDRKLPPRLHAHTPFHIRTLDPISHSTAPQQAPLASDPDPTPRSNILPSKLATPSTPKRAAANKPSVYSSPTKRGRATASIAATSKTTKTLVNTKQLRSDRLGTLVAQLSQSLDSSASWENFVTSFRGRSYLSSGLDHVDHPASPLLRDWRDNGVPVLSTSEPWTPEQLDSCVSRGCHKSATEHSEFLRDEMADFIDSRFWVVLPYTKVRHLPCLQLSPAAIKVERERRPRLLCDHSWYPVNDTTDPHAPPEAMQFGGALHRVLRNVRHADPKYGPVYIAKHDIKDGFYRMFLRADQCPRLAIILPKYDDEPQLVAIPMSSTMGWTQSPPTFSTMSETLADETNLSFQANPRSLGPHRLDSAAAERDDFSKDPLPRGLEDQAATTRLLALHPTVTPDAPEDVTFCPPSNKHFKRPIGETDVFVDDFIQVGQGGQKRMNALRNHLLHMIDRVLAEPATDEPHRNEAISLKKLLQGDGSWNTRKIILGWIVDTIRHTIELPPHRKETLAQIFEELVNIKRVSPKHWASILGKLRFVSVAIPGSAGLFSALQWAQNKAGTNRVRVNRFVRDSLDAFGRLAASLCHRPTRLAEIIPQDPSVLGATDAAKSGMGGIFYTPDGGAYVWRCPFPLEIQKRLASTHNPNGQVTNSDLEHAALLGQVDVMCELLPLEYATIETFSDNTPAVSRVRKGAVSSHGAAAALCRFASDHQRTHRYCHLAHFLPGEQNVMADDASRLQHLTDSQFLSHFEQHYPQPKPWRLLHLRSDTTSKLISSLLCKSPTPPTPARPPELGNKSSASGHPSVLPTRLIRPCPTSPIANSNSSTSSCSASDFTAPAKRVNLSGLVQSRTPYWRWARGSPTWVNQIHEKKFRDPTGSIPYSLLSSRGSATTKTLPSAPTQSTSPSSVTCGQSSGQTTQPPALPTGTSATSPLLLSTGSSDPPSTLPAPAKVGLKPSVSVTSSSPWETSSA